MIQPSKISTEIQDNQTDRGEAIKRGSPLEEWFAAEFGRHDPKMVDLNITALDFSWDCLTPGEDEPADIATTLEGLKWHVERLNGGRLNSLTLKKITSMKGGWCIKSFYGLADKTTVDYFRFKPFNPPVDGNKKGKASKYLGAAGESPRAHTPNVDKANWEKVAKRYGLELEGDCFWSWVLASPAIPIIITEGEKKALAGLAAGHVVISLPGIDCGYRSVSDSEDGSGKRLELIPDLKEIATYERKIYIAFDRDSNPQTVKRVQGSRQKLARLFAELGCETYSIKWDEYKGLDDFIFGAGQEALLSAVKNAQNITQRVSKEGGKDKPKVPPALETSKLVFADLFKDKIRFDASTKQYWQYDGKGKWIACSEEYIFGLVQEYLEESIETFSPSYVRNVIEFARKDILHEGWTEISSLQYLPFINGVLEMETKNLLDHSPDYGFTWQLPRAYSQQPSDWFRISSFLDSLCDRNGQLKDIAIAFCNAVLTGRSDLQKFLYLFGSGANGKGAFMQLLSMLVGRENTHSTTMAELNESRFESANLKGKRLVLMTDEDRRVGGFGIFKAATGQDPIRFEKKGKDASNFVFRGMFVVAANSPTFVGESNPALKRRKVDFPCLARIAESDRRDLIPEFDADLTAFTTHLLSLSDEWVTTTIRGAGSVEAVRKLAWDMAVREDSIASFFDERLVIDPLGSVVCGDLYREYQNHCEETGLRAKSLNNFTPALIELCTVSLGHNVTRRHTRTGKVLDGVRLRRPEGELCNPNTTDEVSLSPTKINQNSCKELERWSQPSPTMQGADLKVVTPVVTAVTEVTDGIEEPTVKYLETSALRDNEEGWDE